MSRTEAESADEKDQELLLSSVRPEEIPEVPQNRFLMRKSPQPVQNEEAGLNTRKREERPRERLVSNYSHQDLYLELMISTCLNIRSIFLFFFGSAGRLIPNLHITED